MKIKVISLWQPWASASVFGVKRNETRHWLTKHRGPIAIHAAKRRTRADRECFDEILSTSPESSAAFADHLALDYDILPFGKIVGIANLAACVPTWALSVSVLEAAWGNYDSGRFAWQFGEVWRLREPVPCVGRQGIFETTLTDDETAKARFVEAFKL